MISRLRSALGFSLGIEINILQAVLAEVSIWNKPYSRQSEAFSKESLKPVRDAAEVRKLMNHIELASE